MILSNEYGDSWWLGFGNRVDKLRENALRHAPHDVLAEPVGRKCPHTVFQGDRQLRLHRGLGQPGERHPKRALHLGVGRENRTARQSKHERPDDDQWEGHAARHEIVEHAEPLGGGELHSRLLARLAHRRPDQVAVAGIPASTGERDLPRPRVVGALGPLDQQDLGPFRTFDQHQGNRRGTCAGRLGRLRLMAYERPAHGGQCDHTRSCVSHCTTAASLVTVTLGNRVPASTRVSTIAPSCPRSTRPKRRAPRPSVPSSRAASTSSKSWGPCPSNVTVAKPARASRPASVADAPGSTTTGRSAPALVTSTDTVGSRNIWRVAVATVSAILRAWEIIAGDCTSR